MENSYLIRVKGHLDNRCLSWFEGYEVTLSSNVETMIYAEKMDQAKLFGMLNRIRDLGLELIDVAQYASISLKGD